MIGRGNIREYATLCVVTTLAAYVIIFGLVFLHEMAHGGTAVALGGYFPFVQVGLGRGGAAYFFPADSPAWKEVLVLLAGPLTNFGAAVVILGWVATGIENRRARLLALLAGELSALGFIFGTGVLTLWGAASGGDVGRALALLNLPRLYQYVVGALWLLLGLALAASLFRLFFKELAAYFPAATYGARLALIVSALAAPVCVIYGAQSFGDLGASLAGRGPLGNSIWYAALLLPACLLLPLALSRAGSEQTGSRFGVSRRQFLSLLACATLLAAARATLFAGDRERPDGLFLSRRPPEVTVAACNVVLNIDDEYRARVRVLMRPFVEEQKFLWRRVKDGEPEDWGTYEQFVREKLPLMLGTEDFRITGHHSEPDAGFFNGTWDRGARVVEAEVNLSRLPYLKEGQGVRVLRIEDFWRSKGAGYIDLTEVELDGGLEFGNFKSQPRGAGAPALRSERRLRWENTSFDRSFAVSNILIKQSSGRQADGS
jgi:hypothetical protein